MMLLITLFERLESTMHEILEFIQKNKLSSVEISDAQGKKGNIEDMLPLTSSKYVAGIVKYVYTWGGSNWPLHEQIQMINKNSIIFVDAYECGKKALLGDLVCKQLFVYQQIKGLIVNGYVRDAHRLVKEGYPIWCKGVTPLGCSNEKVVKNNMIEEYFSPRLKQLDNAILVADDSGCSVIDKHEDETSMVKKLEAIERKEDLWYYCLDRLKMNTFEIICEKKYKDKKLEIN